MRGRMRGRKDEREGVNEGYEVMRGEGGREGEESERRRILLLLSPPLSLCG